MAQSVTRRSILDWLLWGGVAVSTFAIGMPIMKFLFPPEGVMKKSGRRSLFARTDEIPLGGAKPGTYRGLPVLVIRTEEGFRAFSGICTHRECFLSWDEEGMRFECPCHRSTFDSHGSVLSGPASVPLPSMPMEIVEDRIYLGP